MSGDSESELPITQAVLAEVPVEAIAIELSENNFESFCGSRNEEAVENFNCRTEDLSF